MIGPLRGAQDAVDAVRATIGPWLPSVLAEVRRAGGPDLARPYDISFPTTVEAAASLAQYPALALATSGLFDDPRRDSRGNWSASYEVTVRIVDRGADYDDTAARCRWWAVVVRTIVLQQIRRADVGVTSIDWTDEGYQVIDADSSRTLGGVDVVFVVGLGVVTNDRAGALTLPPDPNVPTDPRPLVATTAVQIERKV